MVYNYRDINIILLTSCKILSRALHLGEGGSSCLSHKASGQGGKKKQSLEEQPKQRQKTVIRACSTGLSSLQQIAACVKTSTAKGWRYDELQVVISAYDGWEGGGESVVWHIVRLNIVGGEVVKCTV
jgi:hypothetical protein